VGVPGRSTGIRGSLQLGRLVVAIVLMGVIGLSTLVAVVSKYFDGNPFNPEPLVFPAGPQQIVVGSDIQHIDLLVVSVIGFVLVILLSTAADVIATTRTRHPEWSLLRPLLPPPRPELAHAPLRMITLIPAHNEESSIATTLASLQAQQPPPTGSSWSPTTARAKRK